MYVNVGSLSMTPVLAGTVERVRWEAKLLAIYMSVRAGLGKADPDQTHRRQAQPQTFSTKLNGSHRGQRKAPCGTTRRRK